MVVIDKKLLKRIAATGLCAWCKRRRPTDPHHLVCRGMGGGRRLDVRCNLLALCRECHDAAHRGALTPADLFAVQAARLGVLQDDIRAALNVLRRLDRAPSRLEVAWVLGQVSAAARWLLVEVLGDLA